MNSSNQENLQELRAGAVFDMAALFSMPKSLSKDKEAVISSRNNVSEYPILSKLNTIADNRKKKYALLLFSYIVSSPLLIFIAAIKIYTLAKAKLRDKDNSSDITLSEVLKNEHTLKTIKDEISEYPTTNKSLKNFLDTKSTDTTSERSEIEEEKSVSEEDKSVSEEEESQIEQENTETNNITKYLTNQVQFNPEENSRFEKYSDTHSGLAYYTNNDFDSQKPTIVYLSTSKYIPEYLLSQDFNLVMYDMNSILENSQTNLLVCAGEIAKDMIPLRVGTHDKLNNLCIIGSGNVGGTLALCTAAAMKAKYNIECPKMILHNTNRGLLEPYGFDTLFSKPIESAIKRYKVFFNDCLFQHNDTQAQKILKVIMFPVAATILTTLALVSYFIMGPCRVIFLSAQNVSKHLTSCILGTEYSDSINNQKLLQNLKTENLETDKKILVYNDPYDIRVHNYLVDDKDNLGFTIEAKTWLIDRIGRYGITEEFCTKLKECLLTVYDAHHQWIQELDSTIEAIKESGKTRYIVKEKTRYMVKHDSEIMKCISEILMKHPDITEQIYKNKELIRDLYSTNHTLGSCYTPTALPREVVEEYIGSVGSVGPSIQNAKISEAFALTKDGQAVPLAELPKLTSEVEEDVGPSIQNAKISEALALTNDGRRQAVAIAS